MKMCALLLGLILVMLGSGVGAWQTPPANAGGSPSGGSPRAKLEAPPVDLVFLGPKMPVLLRLHLRIDGKSIRTVMDEFSEKWFRHLDVDKKGYLTDAELSRAPDDLSVSLMMRDQGSFTSDLRNVSIKNSRNTRALSGKVGLPELQAYYGTLVHSAEAAAMRSHPVLDQAGDMLFQLLDLNKDGKLSKEEIQAAAGTLRKLDLGGDEWITLPQLVRIDPNGPEQFGTLPPLPQPDIKQFVELLHGDFFQARAGDNRLGKLLLNRYDRDKIQRLTQKDLDLDSATFAKLDKDGDGGLDSEELSAWCQRPADLEFTIHLGKNPSVQLERARKSFQSCVKESAGICQIEMKDCRINLVSPDVGQRIKGIHANQIASILDNFRRADKDMRGYARLADLQDPLHYHFRNFFPFLDRNGDGYLTNEETQAFAELQCAAMDCFLNMTIVDQGQSLFQLLDANGDHRLSRRELIHAWPRLAALDKDRKGFITPADVGKLYQINVRQTNYILRRSIVRDLPIPYYPEGTPAWFRKMDRNGDGDVSPAEFLGGREEFERIDADRDGLISAEEAIAYEARVRKNK